MSLFGVVVTLLMVTLGADIRNVNGLRCYSCSLTATSGDKRCISDPAAVEGQSIVTCKYKYCTIQRQELLDPPGKLNTFLRGCNENPLYLDDVLEDSTFRGYYRSCSSDLCNSGDGLSSTNELSGMELGASENLLVPGLLNGAQDVRTVLAPWTTFLLMVVLYHRSKML
ncbi:uncharacterized protein LOC131693931 [Topomyia yanbarensis]|uniref:uncharacterized protein LOC131693931 n=1 Tax=Topomyia yanbarensis TaxID=2498891 RepID=UPI00273C262A|nr:uncharacterized protein LOC131693931 [Topomyia yanbarensis]XP_058838192.1 uncharacterized protein LOC131693931 [Topomyia yanbarensis]